RSVAGQDAHVAQRAGGHQRFNAAGEDPRLGAGDFTVHGHNHLLLPLGSGLLGHLGGAFDGFFDAANHVERLLGQVVVLAVQDRLEAGEGIFQRNVLAGCAGEYFGNREGLREETFDFTGAVYGELVVFAQLVHAEDGDDVLQFLVALQDRLYATGHVVVLLADDQRVELAAGGVERVDGGVDTQLGDVTRQYHGSVKVREGGGRRGVGQVVRGYVYGLDRGDRTGLGRGDALLQLAHLFCQGRLVTYGGGHTAEQCRYFGTCQCVTVDVVDEQQYVAAFVTEFFGHGQTGQGHAQTVAGRLVHLAVD